MRESNRIDAETTLTEAAVMIVTHDASEGDLRDLATAYLRKRLSAGVLPPMEKL